MARVTRPHEGSCNLLDTLLFLNSGVILLCYFLPTGLSVSFSPWHNLVILQKKKPVFVSFL